MSEDTEETLQLRIARVLRDTLGETNQVSRANQILAALKPGDKLGNGLRVIDIGSLVGREKWQRGWTAHMAAAAERKRCENARPVPMALRVGSPEHKSYARGFNKALGQWLAAIRAPEPKS